MPELQSIEVGDPVRVGPEGAEVDMTMEVAIAEPNWALVLCGPGTRLEAFAAGMVFVPPLRRRRVFGVGDNGHQRSPGEAERNRDGSPRHLKRRPERTSRTLAGSRTFSSNQPN